MSLNDGQLVSAQCRSTISMATSSGSKVLAMVALGVTLAAANELKPHFGAWGYDAAGADVGTTAGDDFFRHANGAWLDKTEIPADKPGVSLRLAMTDLIEERLRQIMEQASPADLEGKVGSGQIQPFGPSEEPDCAPHHLRAPLTDTRRSFERFCERGPPGKAGRVPPGARPHTPGGLHPL